MSDVNAWLERAAGWRFGSLLFDEPDANRPAQVSALAPLVPEVLRASAATLAAETPLRAEDYYRVLGPGGCPATESAYDRAAIANRGPLIADVAAFYQAFAYPPRLTSNLAPDHIVVELDFLGFLALKIASALHDGRAEDRAVACAAYGEFLDQHPGFWIDELIARLSSGGYAPLVSAAQWVSAFVECERARPAAAAEKGA